MADRIFIMHNGALQQSGRPLTVYQQPANRFVAGFIGSPAMNFIEATIVAKEGGYYLEADGFTVQLPHAFSPRVSPYAGKQVIFGVRPEDVTEHDPAAAGENTLTVRADVVETLGFEIFAYLTCGVHPVVARMEVPKTPIEVGQTCEVDIRMDKTHIFDKETSQTIV